MKHKALVLILLTSLIYACAAKSPQTALEEFYTYNGAEDMLMDPLILAGGDVVPLVIEKIKDKSMPRRRYAIGFLGNGGYPQALLVLQQILQDETEQDYFRGDALQSIYMIDEPLGLELAQQQAGENNFVGGMAKSILKGEDRLKLRRSYSDAAMGYHY